MAQPIEIRVRVTEEGVSFEQFGKKGVTAFRDVEGAANRAKQATREWQRITGGALVAIGASMTAVSLGAIKTASSFDTSMREVNTLSKLSEEGFQDLKSAVLDLPPALGSTGELVEGLYQTISAGITEPAEALGFIEQAAMAAKGGVATLDVAVLAGTKTLEGFRSEGVTSADVFDKLFQTVKLGQTRFSELAAEAGGLSTQASSLNISIDEMLGSLAQLTLSSASTSDAATKLQAVMTGLIKPTSTMEKLFNDLGFASGEAAIEQLGFVGVMEEVQKATGGSSVELGKLFGRKEALIGFTALAQEGFAGASDKIKQMGDSAGSARDAFEEVQKSAGAAFERFTNALGRAGAAMGETFLPAVTKILDAATSLLEFFVDLPGPVQAAAGAVTLFGGAVSTAAGSMLLFAPRLALLTGAGGLPGLAGSAGTAAGGLGKLTTAGGLLGGALKGAAKGASVLGAAFVGWKIGTWINDVTGFTDAIEGTGFSISGQIERLGLYGESIEEINASLEEARRIHLEVPSAIDRMSAAASQANVELQRMADAGDEVGFRYLELDGVLRKVDLSTGKLVPLAKEVADANDDVAKKVKLSQEAMDALAYKGLDPTLARLQQLIDMGAGTSVFEDLASDADVAAFELGVFGDMMANAANAMPPMDAGLAKINMLMAKYNVQIPDTNKGMAELEALWASGQIPAAQMNDIVNRQLGQFDQLGVLTPEVARALNKLSIETKIAADGFLGFFSSIETGIPAIDNLIGKFSGWLGTANKILGSLSGLGGGFGDLFGKISGALGGASGGGGGFDLGGIFDSIKGMFGGGGAGEQIMTQTASNAASIFGGALSTGMGGAATQGATGLLGKMAGMFGQAANFIPVIGPLISTFGPMLMKGMIGLGKKVWGALFGGPSAAERAGKIFGSFEVPKEVLDSIGKMSDEFKKAGRQLPDTIASLVGFDDVIKAVGINDMPQFMFAMNKGNEAVQRLNEGLITGAEAAEFFGAESLAIMKDAAVKLGGDATAQFQLMIDTAIEAGVVIPAEFLSAGQAVQVSMDKVVDVLERVASGSLDVVEAGKLIDESWEELTGAAAELGMVGGLAIRAIVDNMRAAGVESQAVNDFMRDAVTGIADASQRAIASGTESLAGLRLAGAGLLATWQELRAQGDPISDVVAAIGGSAKDLAKQFKEMGAKAPEGLGKLLQFTNLLAKEGMPELVDQATAFGQVFQGLADIGLADQAVFSDFATSLNDTFAGLKAGGATAEQSIALIGPQLQTLADAQTQFGFTVDAGTQKLLDQATAQGVVKGATLDTTGAVTAGFDGMFQRFDAFLGAQGIATEGMFQFGATASTTMAGVATAAQQAADAIVVTEQQKNEAIQELMRLTAATALSGANAQQQAQIDSAKATVLAWEGGAAELDALTKQLTGSISGSFAGLVGSIAGSIDSTGVITSEMMADVSLASSEAASSIQTSYETALAAVETAQQDLTAASSQEEKARADMALRAANDTADAWARKMAETEASVSGSADAIRSSMGQMVIDISDQIGGLKFDVPVNFSVDDFPSFPRSADSGSRSPTGFATALGETRTIPGPPGRPRLIMAHGGETIGQPRGAGINVNIGGITIGGSDQAAIERAVIAALRAGMRGIGKRR
jgi:TP901 family phage tail tape measure protein